ncbi:hypothetical protein KRP22_000426 [Phytophthora ramorum]|uniref:uncharacterized protein n=1 Tax=Phytophthora ramorum TaxID=164328 RepID=UPI0030A89348|nr:hypothetical protein KRP23_7263 [Phytophthora ramorum]KAH7498257.1 hypothetical protein KRP22_12372 [Phytophthora ramorum]
MPARFESESRNAGTPARGARCSGAPRAELQSMLSRRRQRTEEAERGPACCKVSAAVQRTRSAPPSLHFRTVKRCR